MLNPESLFWIALPLELKLAFEAGQTAKLNQQRFGDHPLGAEFGSENPSAKAYQAGYQQASGRLVSSARIVETLLNDL